jgi:oligopeptide transport system permease protein
VAQVTTKTSVSQAAAARTIAIPVGPGAAAARAAGPSGSLWRDAWVRLRRNKAALAGLAFIVVLLFVAIFADVLTPYSYTAQNTKIANQSPSAAHWFGTDELGRDLLTRLMRGARISLAVAFLSQLMIIAIGVPIGAAAGYFGGRVDQLLMRFADVMFSFPDLLLIIIVMSTLRAATTQQHVGGVLATLGSADALFGGLLGVFISLAIISWLTAARLVRGQVLSLKHKEFVEAASALGATHMRILRAHLLPNVMAPIIVAATFGIPRAIVIEAALSFIGLGVQAPEASWGAMILSGYSALRSYPHLLVFPAVSLSLTVLAYNFFGDGLRDALDPWMKR